MAVSAKNYVILTLDGAHDQSAGKATAVSVNAGGSGYSVSDELTVSGGDSNLTLNVDSVSGGAVTGVSITAGGSRYSTGTGNATTVVPTGGTGCTIDIDTVDATMVFNEAVPSSGYPFMLVVSTPFEIVQADAQDSTYVIDVQRRQEGTTNTTQIADNTTVVCELTHEALDDVYGELLAAEKVIGGNETTASRTRTPDINEVTVDTDLDQVFIGVDGTPNTWEELCMESHADYSNLTTSTKHGIADGGQYYTDTDADAWHLALADQHLGSGAKTVSVNAGGTGYSVNDVLTITPSGDDNCTLNVDSVSGGAVTGVSILTAGTGYSVTTGNATTVAPTGGSGCTIDIDSIHTLDHDHLTVPAANMRDLTGEPGDTTEGGVYFNKTSKTIYYYEGGWKQYNTVPQYAMIFRDDGVCPDGWTEKTAWDGKFLKGETVSTWTGGSGGSSTHTHLVSTVPQHAHTIPDRTVTVDAVANHSHTVTTYDSGSTYNHYNKQTGYSDPQTLSTEGAHTHTVTVPEHNTNSGGTSGAVSQSTSSVPKYVRLTLCEKN